MKAIVTLRVYASDWKKIRKIYPALKDETVCAYTLRLAAWLERQDAEWGTK